MILVEEEAPAPVLELTVDASETLAGEPVGWQLSLLYDDGTVSNAGRAYLLESKASRFSGDYDLGVQADATVTGSAIDDQLGTALALGDFTGDGEVDVNDLLDFFQLWGNVCPWIVD